MRLNLGELPQDIILTICTHLHPKDLLSFIQTCRVVHALGSTDYIWHHINHHDLSLDVRLTNLSGPEIKCTVIRALKLDKNWRSHVSKIARISKINHRNCVIDMRPLGREWLVISSRGARSSTINISVWRLVTFTGDSGAVGSSCVAFFEPPGAFSFEAFLENGDTALISVLGGSPLGAQKTQLAIYRLNLKGNESKGKPYVINEWKIDHTGLFYHSQISGPIVAAAIVHISDTSCSHQILLFNTRTNVTIRVESPTLTSFDCGRMQFKIYSRHIVIVGVYQEQIKVHVRELPSRIFSDAAIPHPLDEQMIPSGNWDSFIVDYETPKIRNLEFFISTEPIYHSFLDSFTVMVTYSPFSLMEHGTVNIYRFPIDTSKRDLKFTAWEPAHTFATPPNVTLEPTCLGKTGRRAVWLSHQWNADDYRLMKASFPSTFVDPLQPPELALPFEPHTCQSLSFEEATGRLFVGLHTGDIYILEF